MNRETGLPIIVDLVADCLALSPGEVTPDSRLVPDLGADSLDFVDLLFTLERKFAVELRETELRFLSQLDPEAVQDGHLTAKAIEQLRPWLPAIGAVEDPATITPKAVAEFVTVETLWLLVAKKLPQS